MAITNVSHNLTGEDKMSQFYSGYNSFRDEITNLDLYISWLDATIKWNVVISWLGIVGLGFLAYYMAKIVVRNL